MTHAVPQAFVLDYSFDSSEPGDKTGNYADNHKLFKELVSPPHPCSLSFVLCRSLLLWQGTLMIRNALGGLNTCLFCHGASQSGKTYTLIGEFVPSSSSSVPLRSSYSLQLSSPGQTPHRLPLCLPVYCRFSDQA